MNKLSLVAVIASLALAAPALAQTPSDVRNGRTSAVAQSPSEVRIDHHNSMHGSDMSKDAGEEHHGKKHHSKHHAKKHHAKKHHHKADAAKTDAAPAAAPAESK